VIELALIQTCTPDDQTEALAHLAPLIERAAADGAQLIVTPECSNLMECRAEQKAKKIVTQDQDVCVQGLTHLAKHLGVPILMGSAIVRHNSDNKSVNRAFLFDAHGQIRASYDKIHLFDADTPDGRSYRESHSISPGHQAVISEVLGTQLGLSICYDVRFAALYRLLAKQGAQIFAVNAAFTVPTGQAHWEVLLRARAIETGAFIIAAAQGGAHMDGRTTYGHSLIVNPWGQIIARLDHDQPDILRATLDLSEVSKARQAMPCLQHDRDFSL